MERLREQHKSSLRRIQHGLYTEIPTDIAASEVSVGSRTSQLEHRTPPSNHHTNGDINSMLRPDISPRTIIRTTDHSLVPKQFAGTSSEDGLRFVQIFEQYLRVNSDMDPLKLFPLYMKGSPDLWYSGFIKHQPSATWEVLKAAFLEQFGPKARGYVAQSELMTRQQGPNESVKAYSKDMMDSLALAGCREPQLWTTYVKGLRPQLRARVLGNHPSSIHQAEVSSRENEQLLKLEQQEVMQKGVLNMLEPNAKPQWIDPFLKEVNKTMSKMIGNIQPQAPTEDNTQQPKQEYIQRPANPPPRPQRYQIQNNQPYCTYCRIPGHTYEECRKKMIGVACWTCGDPNHFQSECPHPPRNRRPLQNRQPYRPRWKNNPRPQGYNQQRRSEN